MTEQLTIAERYVEAKNGSDILGAAGMAGQTHSLALKLLRFMHKPSAHKLHELIHEAHPVLEQYMLERRLDGRPHRVARQSIMWWVRPACKECDGLGFAKYTDAPALSSIECPSCNGLGTSRLKTECDEAAKFLIAEMDASVDVATHAIRRKLR